MSLNQMVKRTVSVSTERKLIRQLIRYRWKFYIQTTADAVQRHKHLILLVSLLAGPLIFAILLALAKPLLHLIQPENVQQSIQIWGIFLLLHLLWSGFQQKALKGGEGYQYITMTPVPLVIRLQVELRFLASLSALILLPFIIALIYVWTTGSSYQAIYQSILDSLLILLWGIELLFIQMLVCQRNKYLIALCLASFLAPLSLVLFKIEILSILISFIVVVITFRQWMIGKIRKPRIIQLPQLLRIQALSSISSNWIRISLRKIFNKNVIAQRILFLLFAFSACGVLAWFAQQKDTWILIYIELSPHTLMNLMSAFYVAMILVQISIIKISLASTYTSTERFWMSQGISTQQQYMSEFRALCGIAFIATFPTWIWITFTNGMVNSVFIGGFMLFAVALIQYIFKKPETVHGVVPLLLAMTWFVISYLLLAF
ncbi:hypothetical protein [Acinetobacter sp. P8-3-8]|uniref:hypothetical protein n=1 Tax=Acinetobacter sp. P8-3-8 TaxID=1029823 RepID=UPI00024853BE|nr:hypothetical protein [Acinetobacter sp. P8-3-8]